MRLFLKSAPLAVACILATALLTHGHTASAENTKPYTVNDILNLGNISDAIPSPDSSMVALTVQRPLTSPHDRHFNGRDYGWLNDDVEIFSLRNGKILYSTQGAQDGSSYFEPQWSPDSKTLAIISSRGFDNLRLYAIDIQRRSIRRLTEFPINLETDIYLDHGTMNTVPSTSGFINAVSSYRWLDKETIIASFLTPGETSFALSDGTRLRMQIDRLWSRTELGKEPSFSISDSGVSNPSPLRGSLGIIHVDSGAVRTIADGFFLSAVVSPFEEYAIGIADSGSRVESPDKAIAFPRMDRTFPESGYRDYLKVGIVKLQEHETGIHWFPEIKDTTFDQSTGQPVNAVQNIFGFSYDHPYWLPGSSKVVAPARFSREKGYDGSYTPVIIDAANSNVGRIAPGYDVENVKAGGNSGTIFFRGHPTSAHPESDRWYLAKIDSKTDTPVSIQQLSAALPDTLTSLPAQNALLGVADHNLIKVNALTGKPTSIAEHIDALLSPAPYRDDQDEASGILVEMHGGMLRTLDISGHIIVQTRSMNSTPMGLFEDGKGLLELKRFGFTLQLVAVTPPRYPLLLRSINGFLSNVNVGGEIRYTFIDSHGNKQGAVLCLPPLAGEKIPFPTIVHVYAGQNAECIAPDFRIFNNENAFRGAGYAVLFSTIGHYPARGQPLKDLTRDVIAATKKGIALGLIDPRRVAVEGLSYGAYLTYATITQTTIFKAAIATNGPSDLLDEYAAPGIAQWYDPWSYQHQSTQAELETEHPTLVLGSDPWTKFDLYAANSPIRYVRNIRTPLLIFQSDLDVFSEDNASEMFSGMLRFGRKARLVRFFGEDHLLNSPANIREWWEQSLQWLITNGVTPMLPA